MKSFILIILIAVMFSLPLHAKLSLNLSSDLSYDTNIFQLSDYDIERYEDGEPTLAYIESKDDMIWGSSLKLQYQGNWNKFKFRPYVKAAANRFMSNVDKSNGNLMGTMSILHPIGDMNLSYGYYPDNYLRQYKDKDGSGLYEKFTYDKNLLKADASISVIKHESLYLYLKSEQYFYNHHFTEFDGTATTTGLGWRHSSPQFAFDGTYFFRQFDGKTITDITVDAADAAYESNIYAFGMTWKNWKPQLGSNPINIRPSIRFNLEDRYYQGSNALHNGRKDSIIDLGAGLLIPIQKNLDISLDFSHTMRNVSSNDWKVPRSKEYTEDTYSAGFSYTINLMR